MKILADADRYCGNSSSSGGSTIVVDKIIRHQHCQQKKFSIVDLLVQTQLILLPFLQHYFSIIIIYPIRQFYCNKSLQKFKYSKPFIFINIILLFKSVCADVSNLIWKINFNKNVLKTLF